MKVDNIRVLITGGSGLVGCNLIKSLPDNLDVINIDKKTSKLELKNLIEIIGDIADKELVEDVIRTYYPTHVVHLASNSSVKGCENNQYDACRSNILGTQILCEMCTRYGCLSKFLFVSSSMVYGNFERFEIDEKHKTNPRNLYGYTKLVGEYLVNQYFKDYEKIDSTILRLMAVYGPGDMNKRVITNIMQKLINNEDAYYCNCDNKIAFTYIDDVIEVIKKILFFKNNKSLTLHFAHDEAYTIKEIAKIIFNLVNRGRLIPYEKCDCIKRGKFNSEMHKSSLKYKAKVNIFDGILNVFKYDYPSHFTQENYQ